MVNTVIGRSVQSWFGFPTWKIQIIALKCFTDELILLLYNTVSREIFAALKVSEFTIFQLAVDKILRLLQKFNG
jgi:hypothetical protein